MATTNDERAEKAARAKDRLKKFQAKKKAGSIETSLPISAIQPEELPPTPAGTQELPPTANPLPQQNGSLEPPTAPAMLGTSGDQQQTINLLVDEKSLLNGEIEDLKREMERLRYEMTEADRNATQRIKTLDTQLQQANDSVSHLGSIEQRLKDAQENVVELRLKLDQSREKVAELDQSHASGTDEIVKEYEAKMRMRQTHSDALESELSRVRNQLKSLEERDVEKEANLQRLSAKISTLESELLTSTSQAIDVKAAHDTLQTSNNELQTTKSKLENDLKTCQSALTTLQSHTSSLESQVSSFENTKASLLSQISAFEQKTLEYNSRKDSLQKDNQSLLQSLEELRLKIVVLTNEKAESSERLEEFRRIVREREQELVTMREELGNARSKLELVQVERQAADEAKFSLEAQLSIITTEKSSLEQAIARQNEQAEQFRVQTETLSKQLQVAETNSSQLAEELSMATKQSEDLKVELTVLQTSWAKLNSGQAEIVDKLREALQETEKQRDQLETVSAELKVERQQKVQVSLEKDDVIKHSEMLKTRLDELDANLKKAEEHSLQLEQWKLEHSEKTESMRLEHEEIVVQLHKSKDESSRLESKLSNTTGQLHDLCQKLDFKISEVTELSSSLESQKIQLVEKTRLLENSESESTRLSNELEHFKSTSDQNLAESAKLLDEVRTKAKEGDIAWSTRYSQLSDQLETLKTSLLKSEEHERNLGVEMSQLQAQLEEKRKLADEQLARATETIQSKDDAIEGLKSELKVTETNLNKEIQSLNASLAAKDNSIEQSHHAIESLNARVQSSEQVVKQLESDVTHLTAQLADSRSDLVDERQNLASALHDLSRMKDDLTEHEVELCESRETIKELKQSNLQTESEYQVFKEKMDKTVVGFQSELNSRTKQMELKDEELNQAGSNVEELRREISKLEVEKSELIQRMEDGKEGENRVLELSRAEILDLKHKLQVLKDEEDSVKRDLSQTKLEFEQNDQVKEREIHRLNGELKAVRRGEAESKSALEKLNDENKEMAGALSAVRGEIKGSQQRCEDLTRTLEGEKLEWEQKFGEQSSAIESLSAQLAQNQQDRDILHASLLQSRQIAENDTIVKGEEISRLSVELKSVRDSLQTHQDELEAAVRRYQQQTEYFETRENQFKVELDQLTKRIGSLNSEHSRELQKIDQERREEVSRIRSQHEAQEKELASSRSALEGQLQSLVRNADQSNSDAVDQRRKDEKTIQDLKVQIEAVKAELSRTQVERDSQQAIVDQDYLDSIMQQHSMDLSSARTQIRNLETKLFEEESKSNEMLRRIGDLTDQLRGAEEALRTRPSPIHSIKPDSPERPRRAEVPALSITEPPVSPSLSKPGSGSMTTRLSASTAFANTIDERSLSARTRHQRKQSLNMLKARMEEELGLNDVPETPRSASEGFGLENEALRQQHQFQQHQRLTLGSDDIMRLSRPVQSKLGDDMVWCGHCDGDLFVI